ncbi:MAG: hypothetical protein N2442_06845 [Spirochaetes bacterium]|nr:hypothetical protein [Spirochaetota bacterium]
MDNTTEVFPYTIRINVNTSGGGTGSGGTGGSNSYLYEETFDTVTITNNSGASYWYKPSGCTGIVQVVNDPTGAGKGKVLELKDTIISVGDMGAIVYSPVIDSLKNENIVGKTLELDFYFANDVGGRWFLLAKTHQQAFIMHDPNGKVDAYASGQHSYIDVSSYWNSWLKLKVEFQSGGYNVYVYNGSTPVGQILGKPNNSESYDAYSSFLNSSTAGNGRLFFGSWFSNPGCLDNSYGHTYIDNIRVY